MARDQGAARQQTPYLPQRCSCTHLSTLHTLPEPGCRGACSSSLCDCRRFTPAEPTGDAA